MSNTNPATIQNYIDLICSMIQSMDDFRFIRQIYSIVYRQLKRNYLDNTPQGMIP